jgi:hypothetical protein
MDLWCAQVQEDEPRIDPKALRTWHRQRPNWERTVTKPGDTW